MTLLFAFLLVATLLTVSVNQRLGEIAALRALGIGRRAHRRDAALGIRAAGRHRRRCWRCRSASCSRWSSTASCARCPASPSGCTSSSSSRGRVVLHAALLAVDRRSPRRSIRSGWSRVCRLPRRCGGRCVVVTPFVEARDCQRGCFRCRPARSWRCATCRCASTPATTSAITGPSGCGKSTLLHLLGCVDTPTSGSLLVRRARRRARCRMRSAAACACTRIGFVFQRFFLLPMLTASENVELPQAEAGVADGRAPRADARAARLRRACRRAPITGRRSSPAAKCSGSRSRARWRTGRALLLADEPTGELDEDDRRADRGAVRSRQRRRHRDRRRHARPGAGRARARRLAMHERRDGRGAR